MDRLWAELAYLGSRLNWSLESVLDLDHPTRHRVIQEISKTHRQEGSG
ncbi:DUF6760 family protein [Phytohabitans suffuscus]|uniref:DUF6760 domain-containing protein n=1 Tax=Phytohabitans suffuscus TaxID=624315 RepID=A0A6F8YRZ9_9ACTN|nr:DUF6760 family protein [Phytohabitans suffuscus]BCB88708.1 hypothetical protein Psuf_060210 [Phytohabitans suffuscus]